jgi:hypothetical protein
MVASITRIQSPLDSRSESNSDLLPVLKHLNCDTCSDVLFLQFLCPDFDLHSGDGTPTYTSRPASVPVWRVLGLRMEGRPPAMDGSCEYIE